MGIWGLLVINLGHRCEMDGSVRPLAALDTRLANWIGILATPEATKTAEENREQNGRQPLLRAVLR